MPFHEVIQYYNELARQNKKESESFQEQQKSQSLSIPSMPRIPDPSAYLNSVKIPKL